MATPAAEILAKAPLPTLMDSEEIRTFLSAEIRRRSFFSARTTALSYIKTLQRVCAAYANGQINAADARLRCIQTLAGLGFDVEGAGGLRDPASTRRLELILETQRKMAASAARLQAQTPDELEAWPAWRLERYGTRREPREDWPARWYHAGQAVGWQGAVRSQMVALKNSPIWQALGDGEGGFRDTLGNPYPPFAFGSGLEWTDVSAEEAERLGLPRYQPTAAERVSLAPTDREIRAAADAAGLSAEDFIALNRAGDSGVLLNSRPGFNKCPECGRFMGWDGSCSKCGHTLSTDEMIQRGREALSRATQGKPRDVIGAMHKEGLGRIDFLQGWRGKGPGMTHGRGIVKLQQKHPVDLDHLPETIAKGRVCLTEYKSTGEVSRDSRAIIHGGYVAYLSRNGDGWVVTTHYNDPEEVRDVETFDRQKRESRQSAAL